MVGMYATVVCVEINQNAGHIMPGLAILPEERARDCKIRLWLDLWQRVC